MRRRFLFLLVACFVAACGAQPELHPLTDDCAGGAYIDEFRAVEFYSTGLRSRNDSGVEVYLDSSGGPWHSVWLKRPGREATRILTIRDADPGSGPLISFGWSRDGQALFIRGAHSGVNGKTGPGFQDMHIIYTLSDGKAWDVGGG
jgi:hypothetical protein